MPQLELRRLSFSHADSVPLLRDVELRLEPGWYGAVGANGSGKTTFLRLVAGELEPDAGAIALRPPGGRVAFCAQAVETLTSEVRAFADAVDGRARELHGRLALDPSELARWPSLSPGERKRWQVGAALAGDPVLLLLDEPTNHLDADARELCLGALESFAGIGVVVSHDRTLLNRLTQHTLRFRAGAVALLHSPYDVARETWAAEERERRGAYERLRQETKKAERRLQDRRERQARAQKRMRKSHAMRGSKDSSTRLVLGATRRRSADTALGRDIHKTHDAIARLEAAAGAFLFEKEVGRQLFIDYRPAPLRTLLQLRCDELRAGDTPLLRDVDVALRRESRVLLAGPNGSGKTTLLRRLLGGAQLPPERLLYLPQELDAAEEIALLEELRATRPDERASVLNVVAALGVAPEPLLASRRPSPGEARKLALAFGLVRQVWALVLDEPTNHLDLPSIERLEQALAGYPGALLVVTHDERFAARLVHTTWRLAGGRVVVS